MNQMTESDLPETWTIEEDGVDDRLDKHLSDRFPHWSRTLLQDWIKSGKVLVDGVARKASFRMEPGMVLSTEGFPEKAATDSPVVPQDIPLAIVYEDERIVVIDKQAGLTVHPGAGCPDGTLANALAFRYGKLSGVNGPVRPGIVHRLDRDTTGLMVVARDDEAHKFLAAQLLDRSLSRVYDALVWGIPAEGRIEAPIGRDPHLRTRMAVTVDGRIAATTISVTKAGTPCSLVECKLETGRTHQIRVHLSHLRCPVVGDPVYGGGPERLAQVQPLDRVIARATVAPLSRQCLHARELRLVHPDGRILTFTSPWPADFSAAVTAAFPD
jgi:23S rRNA pseudouridine1911/1915/1917 synthase